MKNKYRIVGDFVAIQLRRNSGRNLYTWISRSDLPNVSIGQTRWYAHHIQSMDSFYVRADTYESGDGKRKRIYMHRKILGASGGSIVDHKNGNTLDNRHSNLHVVTKSGNMHNLRKSPAHNTSGVLNVGWDKRRNKYRALVQVNGKNKFLGYFDDTEKAAQAVSSYRAKHNLGGNKNVVQDCKAN